jgi:hypothetical protein
MLVITHVHLASFPVRWVSSDDMTYTLAVILPFICRLFVVWCGFILRTSPILPPE